jgi:hypothetical protein
VNISTSRTIAIGSQPTWMLAAASAPETKSAVMIDTQPAVEM